MAAALMLALLALITLPSLANAYIYWADSETDSIGRANLDGSGVDQGYVAIGGEPTALAAASGSIFWTDFLSSDIGRVGTDGSGLDRSPAGGCAYRVTLQATDAAGNRSSASRAGFRIVGG